ncbi:hypothetical protein Tco_1372441 [Tanacetum coccineum]
MSTREVVEALVQSRDREGRRRLDILEFDLGIVEWNGDKVKHKVVTLKDRVLELEQDGVREENKRLRKKLESAEVSVTLARMDQDRVERDLYHLRVYAYGLIMPPRRMTHAAIKRLIAKRVAATLDEDRANRENVGGPAGGAGGPAAAPVSCKCTYAGFMKCDPSTFSKVEGAVGICRLFERLELVFRISKCAKRNKVKFATSTLQELRKLMTTEFCLRDEIQRMEQELAGHRTRDCRSKAVATGANTQPIMTFYAVEKGGTSRVSAQTRIINILLYLSQVTEKEPVEKRLGDVPLIRDFPEVFPEDLLGLSLPR